MLDDNNKKTDLRGSPIFVNFDNTDPANNEFLGPNMLTCFLKENIEDLEKIVENQSKVILHMKKQKHSQTLFCVGHR